MGVVAQILSPCVWAEEVAQGLDLISLALIKQARLVGQRVQGSSFLHLLSSGVIITYYHVWLILHVFWGPNLSIGACEMCA